ncbi:ABC transporter permease [Priestia taiwanensis]|uniref:ABC transporter permease n=1 Tax=Priestia taiwanensis TaxID=1347902 RepID=A0A917AV97_9BACI|nr:ABC transporter permease [Priestia taiwanensis]MBM7363536.1 putative ABC transport system permease protein [Priestia taiwanensis]GGE76313.1 ABC transporter permease [Priestia taiwanensis]
MTFRQFAYRNITRNTRAYAAYFLSSTFSIFIFFSFAICMFHPSMYVNQDITRHIEGSLLAAEVAIVFFSFFFILYSMNAFLKVRRKEFGILIMLGISRKQLNRLLFMENMLIGIISIVCGILIGLLFSNFFLQLLGIAVSTTMFYFYIPIKAYWVTTCTFTPLFLVLSFLVPRSIRQTKVSHLLRQTREKKHTIFVSILLSILAFSCLYRGYYLAYTAASSIQNNTLLSILFFVSLGTYLLFRQGSIFLLYLLTLRRSFYMRKTNMIWISNLSHRLRDNAMMLFIVTILSAISFTAIASLYSVKTIEQQELEIKHPFAFTFYYKDTENTEDTHMLQQLENALQNESFTYERFVTPYIKIPEEQHTLIVLANSDYNQLSNALNRPLISLEEKEAYLAAIYRYLDIMKEPFFNQSTVSFPILDAPLTVTGFTSKAVLPHGIGTYVILVHDNVFTALQKHYPTMNLYNYNVPNWQYTGKIASTIYATYPDSRATFTSAAYWFDQQSTSSNLMLYIGTFIGIIFFVAAGSFLYFRLYTDLNKEKETYYNMSKIGLSYKEMKKAATVQIALLFFAPFLLATVHTFFALRIPEQLLEVSLLAPTMTVLSIFGILQIIYFFVLRSLYIRHLARYMV